MFAQMEIDAAVSWLRGAASHDLPEERFEDDEKILLVRYTPLGVAVGIVPWNFPILLACGKIGMSIVTGNPIIIKPSPFTPAGGLKLVELGQQFFPPGVLQGLSGDDNLGIWLVEHETPAKVSFTGSTATGKKVMASASKTLKRVTLELGGKDPAIILDDVNIEEVAAKVRSKSKTTTTSLTRRQIATYAFLNSGQVSFYIPRLIVEMLTRIDLHRHQANLRPREDHRRVPRRHGPIHKDSQAGRRKRGGRLHGPHPE